MLVRDNKLKAAERFRVEGQGSKRGRNEVELDGQTFEKPECRAILDQEADARFCQGVCPWLLFPVVSRLLQLLVRLVHRCLCAP